MLIQIFVPKTCQTIYHSCFKSLDSSLQATAIRYEKARFKKLVSGFGNCTSNPPPLRS